MHCPLALPRHLQYMHNTKKTDKQDEIIALVLIAPFEKETKSVLNTTLNYVNLYTITDRN